MYLDVINSPDDLKKLNVEELSDLAGEIRAAMMNRLSNIGGHFGSNFGIVEATIAMHYVFKSTVDKIVFDVSHQCYTHKILTGRKHGYLDNNSFDKVSGFTNPDESEHDMFNIGHTSTSVSLALGLARGRDLRKAEGNVIAVIGDGSLSGGEAFEGLDCAAEFEGNFIIVVNDNDMSIAENHGGIYKNLRKLRESNGMCECNLFRAMGLDYIYVADGNDIPSLIKAFEEVRDITHPIVVHINTLKGKGYSYATENKEEWHWHSPFDVETGKNRYTSSGESYDGITNEYLMAKMKSDEKVTVVTASLPTNIGFTEDKRREAGRQFIDVGIAEEHAIAFVSGIAKNGAKPVFATHSTVMQRTFDQLSHDLCINKSPATILVNTASVYGMNDIGHLGIYDIPLISNIPEIVYLAPTNAEEYLAMLEWSIEQTAHPVAIRMPCGKVMHTDKEVDKDYSDLNRYRMDMSGCDVAIIGLGNFYHIGKEVAEAIRKKTGIAPTLINPRYITGLDKEILESLKKNHKTVITLEDGILDGGFGQKIASFYGPSDMKVYNYGLKKEFVDRYDVSELLDENGITVDKILSDIL